MWHMLCVHRLEQAPPRALGIRHPPQGPGLQGLPGSQPVVRRRLSPDRADAGRPMCRGLSCCVSKALHTNSSRAGQWLCQGARQVTVPAWTAVLVRNLPALQASQADQGQRSLTLLPRAGRHPSNLGVLLSQPCTQPLPQATQVKLLRARVRKAADYERTRRAKSGT